ncbi:hypothetical protein COCSUDRAFT_65346 [Coccomyxa subellipsoidea C-169]|uniref:Trichome birefringence-like C-terminal domain-containing protein n=1 Tax=Coccomyxa subellipsoidea (strain C-169) TaxID=574566 RepID=I0Z196_COCSC|nr:hypothetical protein COCSUDRAFT_65346 [Coccomyxa subellipsoidea C-169]EIE24415.1 hypothetical protein COCSUDRAFT_65346 [Coccomyxa subellipsoidea C-169]|eukprot:XP_005648959.1 hypothetical protein COCSUDRAFT_65346 [Coccomyxa subellipsoidea C-169]
MCLVCTFQDDLVRARESALWRWQPDGCNLFDFRPARLQQEHNVSSLLANLGQRKIIFVGDSLVLEQYLSLEGLLGSEIVGANEEFVHINGRLHNSQAASFMTRTGLQVHFVRSDYLVNKETMQIDTPQAVGAAGSPVSAPHHAMTNSTPHNVITNSAPQYVMTNTSHLVYGSTPWAHMLAHPNSHLVISTSAHWATTRGTGPGRHAAAVQTVARHLAANFKGERVFVRASVPGHPQCHLAQGPYSDALYAHEASWHNWGEFAAHNDAWRNALRALNDSRFVFLDVEPLTRARPDGHLRPGSPDCLHYCLPGVIDYWTLLLASFWMSCRS